VGLKTILAYDIHNLVPLETGTTFQELADKTGVPVKKLTRLLRFAMTDHFFQESRPGYIKHTSATKALVLMPNIATWSQMGMYEVSPAKMHVRIYCKSQPYYPSANRPHRLLMQLPSGQNPKSQSMQYVLPDQDIRRLSNPLTFYLGFLYRQ
jgi:hypothetical protein